MKSSKAVKRRRVSLDCSVEPSRTDPSFAQELDINNIVKRYVKTGVLGDPARAAAQRYGDFSQIPSFHEMMNRISAANEVFAALPSRVRESFDNDPGRFITASSTPEGAELMVKLGLATKREPKPPVEAPKPSKKAPKSEETE